MNPRLWVSLIAALVLVGAACGGDDAGTGDGDPTGGDGGSIVISGSSTVEPISARNAEKFSAENPDITISVEGPGTGDGFKKFCEGQTDISDASRAIKESEAEDCAANGVDYVELEVAIDGLSVLTSLTNDAVACLDFKDLYALMGPESLGFDNWSDADALAAELGAGHAPYPDAPLVITAPGEESGTYDTFVEFVIEDLAEERGAENAARLDYVASPNDNVIIDGIAGSDTSLGWVGYAFFVENQDKVAALAVDDGASGCVEPTPASIADGSYPLSRPLFIYVNTGKAAEKPELADYVDFYLSTEGLASVAETGYVELADYSDTFAAWENR
ncbi:MAG: phosphate ABC transporter substrate-binding protein PstS family protein [Acidimicrobiia bacterium]|nr:phosphate ABC transporter substrate-binding protein PstS family protein [Acidimicrobiia bacterium]NNF10506.1 phosphate ABC transporter substrate-binding protein PstS family protein [Acidimicrobiia bacterium]